MTKANDNKTKATADKASNGKADKETAKPKTNVWATLKTEENFWLLSCATQNKDSSFRLYAHTCSVLKAESDKCFWLCGIAFQTNDVASNKENPLPSEFAFALKLFLEDYQEERTYQGKTTVSKKFTSDAIQYLFRMLTDKELVNASDKPFILELVFGSFDELFTSESPEWQGLGERGQALFISKFCNITFELPSIEPEEETKAGLAKALEYCKNPSSGKSWSGGGAKYQFPLPHALEWCSKDLARLGIEVAGAEDLSKTSLLTQFPELEPQINAWFEGISFLSTLI